MDFKRLLSESFNKPSVIPPGYILGSCFLGLGIIGLVSPSQAEIAFPVRQHDDDMKEQDNVHPAARGGKIREVLTAHLYSKAGRDLVFGLSFFALQYQGNMRAVVALEGLVTLVGFVDGFSVWKYGAEDARPLAWSYWIWSASILAIAGGRFYFLPSSQ
ncbi:uncharacterized protein PG998_003915 [Apiospora kogelbergensis]|uniref:Uncharacterized protein n=1 Tax=Apiospora kogelbergensis TaxID=1337665 RepID=A0AAW0QJE3_9PEZI